LQQRHERSYKSHDASLLACDDGPCPKTNSNRHPPEGSRCFTTSTRA
jgi:hypothetical protein